jgi:glutathione synthase/RimK-type ligase-like ATP-grasp enzyme
MKIGILTCDQLPNLLETEQFLIPELQKFNHNVTAEIWNDINVKWSDFDLLLFRNTWDYFEKQSEFDLWLKTIETFKIRCLNSLETIQKNKHKFYLKELQSHGIKIIPTVFIAQTANLNLQNLIPSHWTKAVIKPAYSGGSYQTKLFDISDVENITIEYKNIAGEKDLLLQSFIPEIESVGETSFIFFNKKFSHCVNKMPIKGDFRVQSQFGGNYKSIYPNQHLIFKVQKIVNTFSEDLLYCRVDCIILNNDLLLMEVECIEPDLYFELCTKAKENFIKALIALL